MSTSLNKGGAFGQEISGDTYTINQNWMLYKGNIGPLRYKNCFEVILNENLINWR